MRISKNSQQNNSDTLQMRMIKKYLKKGIYLRRKTENYWNYMISNSIIMEYQWLINLLDNTPNQPTKFRTKNWVEINDDVLGTHSTNSQFEIKTSMLKSGLCDYSDACILVSGTITTNGAGVDDNAKQLYERNKVVIFKNCAPFTDCISEINNAQVENAKDLNVVMLWCWCII